MFWGKIRIGKGKIRIGKGKIRIGMGWGGEVGRGGNEVGWKIGKRREDRR